ncbi:hypothetical protein BpHYR1_003220 [Brachionus plicatilis]|uniref:Uncharacterized protein n=1 Tax=Brachionus plicatilis TaxID=10195 RepID=A0A3M7RX33_BRAPC|nr:hypothetical protein BpHYR1_003220 [Brachionus plicatilis]
MFKIPTYDELENKEKEQDEKRSEFKQNLFQKRKLIKLNDTRDNFNPEKEEQSEKLVSKCLICFYEMMKTIL